MSYSIRNGLAVLAVLTLAITASATVPHEMNFQGILTDAGGIPLPDSTYVVMVRVYDAPAGGFACWEETDTLTTQDGLFNILLGQNNPLSLSCFDGTTRYLGIQPTGQGEMFPRSALVTVPYTFRSAWADTAEVAMNQGGGGGWSDDGTVVRLEDSADSIGVGTSTPQARIEVVGDLSQASATALRVTNSNPVNNNGAAIQVMHDGVDRIRIQPTHIDMNDPAGEDVITLHGGGPDCAFFKHNVGIGVVDPSEKLEVDGVVYSTNGGFKFPDGTTQTTSASAFSTILDYGSSTSGGTPVSPSQLKICYGKVQLTSSNLTISGLPFVSASTYTVVVTRDLTDYVSQAVCTNKLSGSAFEIRDFTINRWVNWVAIGY